MLYIQSCGSELNDNLDLDPGANILLRTSSGYELNDNIGYIFCLRCCCCLPRKNFPHCVWPALAFSLAKASHPLSTFVNLTQQSVLIIFSAIFIFSTAKVLQELHNYFWNIFSLGYICIFMSL